MLKDRLYQGISIFHKQQMKPSRSFARWLFASKDFYGTGAIDTYIVSMTQHSSDLLCILLFAKEAGIWGSPHYPKRGISIVPLFETVDDLRRAPQMFQELLDLPIYREYLEKSNNLQEIMIGYSDSGKNGGIVSDQLGNSTKSPEAIG